MIKLDLWRHIQQFAELQSDLIGQFVIAGGLTSSGSLSLPNKSLRRIIDSREQDWDLRIHGAGVLFQSVTTRTKVDVHCHLEEPRGIDAWRLQTYLASLPTGKRRSLERELQGRSVDAVLEELAARDQIERTKIPNFYRVP